MQAIATDKLPSFIGSIAILAVFISEGLGVWPYAVAVALGYTIGSYFGVRLTIKKGNHWVQRFVIVLVLASVIKMLLF